MPHKNNPVAAISARACARRAPGLVATLFAAMEQEHERGAGTWHAEWPTLTELLATVGSAASWLTECLGGLRLDTDRMAAGSPRPETRSWPARSPTRSRPPWARAPRTTPAAGPSAAPRPRAGRSPSCSPNGTTSTAPPCSPTAPRRRRGRRRRSTPRSPPT